MDIVYYKYMNKSQNSQYGRFSKYSIFAVVLSVFLSVSFTVSAQDTTKNTTGQEHRSDISKIVQSLRSVAGQDSNIGQEISKIAKEQEDSAKKAEEAMDGVDRAGGVRTLFFGTEY